MENRTPEDTPMKTNTLSMLVLMPALMMTTAAPLMLGPHAALADEAGPVTASSRPPVDLTAPETFETATFALG